MSGKRVAYFIGAGWLLAGPLGAYWFTQSTQMAWLTLIAAVAFLCLTRLDDLTELAFGPLRAKLRKTITEAEATLKQLRSVAAAATKAALANSMSANFMAGLTLKSRLQLRDELMRALDEIGATPAQKRETERAWRSGMGVIYFRVISSALRDEGDLGTCVYERLKPLLVMDEWRAPTPKQIKKAFSPCGYEPSEKVAMLLEDYQHYLSDNEIRRLDLLDERNS